MFRFLPFVLVALLVGCASTPDRPPRGDTAAEGDSASAPDEFDRLDERLDLTDAQEASVRQALDAYEEALIAARRQPDIASRTAERQRARTETDARILATLTAEQREAFAEIRAEREPEYDPLVQQRLYFLTRRLDLTDDQREAIAPILTRLAQRLEPLVALSRRESTREEAIAQAEAFREEADDEILALLDADQAVNYQRLIDERDAPGRRRGGRR